MADPLSIASGIAGLLSLGIQVTQSLIDFYSAYKDQGNYLANTAYSMENLQNVFRSLDLAIKDRQYRADAQELLQQVDKATRRCDEIIRELQVECQKFHTASATTFKSRVQVAGRRVAYPFRKSTLQKLEEDVSEIRENLSFALNILHLKGFNQVENDLSELKLLSERINASQISSALRDWLKAPNTSHNHSVACAKRHPGTGLWFVNGHHFANWLVQHNSFLWLNGFAGCGKSILCSTAIQHTFHKKCSDGVGIAYFYFSFDDESKQDDHGMLRALLLQLSVQFQDGQKELEQLYALHKSGTPSVEILLESLGRFLVQFREVYIFLDALDESPRDHRREGVLRSIMAIRNWSLPSVHILATSRDQVDIRNFLTPTRDCDLSMKNFGIDRDIADFVSYQLENDTKLQRWKLRHIEIERKLTEGAQGVFRYVECQLNALRRARNRNQLDECLHSLPRDLDETYERILCSIDQIYVEDVRRILTMLCFSFRPLTVDQLIDAHAVELNEPPHLDREGRSYRQDDLVDICLGLVEIVTVGGDDGEKVSSVHIAHFSVQEYLQSDRIRQQRAERFAMINGPAHTEISQICLVYLLEPALSIGILDEVKLAEFPLARFAAMHWHHHYIQSAESKPIEKLLSRLFQDDKNSFVTWIRLHDIDRPWDANVDYRRAINNIATPLYYAALIGSEDIVNNITLVDAKNGGASRIVNIQGGTYGNALQAASHNGHEKVVQMLLDRGADIHAQHELYGSALQTASYEGHETVVQMLLDRGANINTQGGYFGNALQAASYEGHEAVVQMLLDQGANINAQGGEYTNSLYAASLRGREQVVRMLLDRCAEVNAQGGYFGNAIQAASYEGHQKVVQILLIRGADIHVQCGEYGNALQAASLRGREQVVRILLNQCAKVNAQGGYFSNALQAASCEGHQKVVQILLDHGANVNAQGGEFGNALQAASCEGHQKVVQILLDSGANVNAQGGEYGNALQAASYEGHENVVQILLDRGADFRAEGEYFGNALQAASLQGHEMVIHMLLERGADINAKGGYFGNALQAATLRGRGKVVQMLLDRGANIDAEESSRVQ